ARCRGGGRGPRLPLPRPGGRHPPVPVASPEARHPLHPGGVADSGDRHAQRAAGVHPGGGPGGPHPPGPDGARLRDPRRGAAALAVRVLRCGVWVGAAVAIAVPGLVQAAAELLGIGRGADVVLYLSVLAFMWAAFFLYARCLRLEREITALTRHLAIRDAARG